MTKFQYAGSAADYPTLGFAVAGSGSILDGSLSSPAITTPPDARWSVYGGGSAETGINRYASPSGPTSPAEPSDGFVLRYSDADNSYVPTSPTDFIDLPEVTSALTATFAQQWKTGQMYTDGTPVLGPSGEVVLTGYDDIASGDFYEDLDNGLLAPASVTSIAGQYGDVGVSQIAAALDDSFASRTAVRQGGAATGKTTRKLAVLMMDDGYLTDLTVVKPILDSLGITKCTLGINTANVNVGGSVPDHLTWAQIKSLKTAGWEITNHGATHANLSAANAALVKSEITDAHTAALAQGVTFTGMIWPFHAYDALALTEARRLYPYAAGGPGSLTYADGAAPLGTYALSRTILNDSTTLADAKALYDTAVSTTSLAMVFGHSSTGLGSSAQTVLHDSIAYAQGLGFEFVTLSEAIAAVGNPVEVGDAITSGGAYFQVSRGGKVAGSTLAEYVVTGDNASVPLAADAPTTYPDGKLSFRTTFGSSGGWPVSGVANIITNRVRSHGADAYTVQEFIAPSGDMYSRRAASASTWSAWSGPYQAAAYFVAPSGLGLSSNYDAWPVGTSVVGAVAGGPGGVNGTLVNTRVQASASNPQLYSVQFFHDYGGSTGAVWRRMSTGATSWSTWTVLPQVTTGTAAPATTPKYVGQEFIDTTAKKVYKATGTASSADWSVLN